MSPGVFDILPSTLLWGTPVSALQYWTAGANPLRMDADSDGDGIPDVRELVLNFNPALADTDGNGTNDIDPVDLDNPDKGTEGVDLVPHVAKKREVKAVLNNSFGFGGTNASLIMKLPE